MFKYRMTIRPRDYITMIDHRRSTPFTDPTYNRHHRDLVMSWKSIAIVLPIFLGLTIVSQLSSAELTTKYEWKYIDYTWNNCAERNAAIESGDYDPKKPIIIDTDVAQDGRVFVTVVRRAGVPSSLNTISDEDDEGGPLLTPYPNWDWAKINGDCRGIVNVYRIFIDKCNRLWVMDNGMIDGKRICSAKMFIFNLRTDKFLFRFDIPDIVAFNAETGRGLLVTPMVDYKDICQTPRFYIADVEGNALVVFNGTFFRRIESPVYEPQASASTAEIAGESFYLPDGVLGMALSPVPSDPSKSRILVSRPFASLDIVVTETKDVFNAFHDGIFPMHTVYSGVLPSQAVAMGFSSEGILFFGLTNETALACWNMNQPMRPENIELVDRNPITHQFVSGLKVIKLYTNVPESVWMVTNRYQKAALDKQNFDEINFRILTGSVADLIDGTKCSPRAVEEDVLNNCQPDFSSQHNHDYHHHNHDYRGPQTYRGY